jgi:hypothetical protein
MKKIYFDTEFTNLTPQSKLISIGLIEDNENKTFYAELSDGYTTEDCSEFCQKEVLIHLEGGVKKMTRSQLRSELWEWIIHFKEPVLLLCDNKKDAEKLIELYPEGLPMNCQLEVIGFFGNLKRGVFNRNRRLHKKNNWRVHHALDDAKVNRLVLS